MCAAVIDPQRIFVSLPIYKPSSISCTPRGKARNNDYLQQNPLRQIDRHCFLVCIYTVTRHPLFFPPHSILIFRQKVIFNGIIRYHHKSRRRDPQLLYTFAQIIIITIIICYYSPTTVTSYWRVAEACLDSLIRNWTELAYSPKNRRINSSIHIIYIARLTDWLAVVWFGISRQEEHATKDTPILYIIIMSTHRLGKVCERERERSAIICGNNTSATFNLGTPVGRFVHFITLLAKKNMRLFCGERTI